LSRSRCGGKYAKPERQRRGEIDQGDIVPFFIAPLAGTHQYMQTFIPG
jgi:hypothetical protein